MPFTRTQSLLKMILPDQYFTIVYMSACKGYNIWTKLSDELYYFFSYFYYMGINDAKKLQRVKTICLIRPYTMVGRSGLLHTYDIAANIEEAKVPGCFVECGVARGGCSALMALVVKENKSNRVIYLFDTFEGMPEHTIEDETCVSKNPSEKDRCSSILYKGYCLGTIDDVSELLFAKLGLDESKIFMVKGLFQDTLPIYKDKLGEISFLRLDGDWYESTKCCLENLFDTVVPGGYIFIDDYHLAGCKKAVDEFLDKRNLKLKFIFDNRGGAYFVKP